jgi:signal transduction histidine kinase
MRWTGLSVLRTPDDIGPRLQALKRPALPQMTARIDPDYFADTAGVHALQDRLSALHDASPEHGELCVQLAWALRQRDTAEALRWLDQAGAAGDTPRAWLVRAEASWLFNRPVDAVQQAARAEAGFAAAGDAVGQGDAALTLVSILDETGGDRDQALRDALAHYRRAGHAARIRLAEFWVACVDVVGDAAGLGDRWPALVAEARVLSDPGIDVYVQAVEAAFAWNRGDLVACIVAYQQAFDAAMATGQLRAAISIAENLGNACCSISDREAALEWAARARDLAQPTGWPYATAWCLMQTAAVLVSAGSPADGKAWLLEGLPLLAEHPGTRNHAIACQVLGEACLALGQDDEALAWCDQSLMGARAVDGADLICATLRFRAQALAGLGRLTQALQAVDEARSLALTHRQLRHLPALEHAMSRIALQHGLPAPAGSSHASGTVHHLQAALQAGAQVAGFQVPPEWHEELAVALEAAGDSRQALQAVRDAAQARERQHSRRSEAILQTLLVRHQTEQARADAAKARAEAESHALRARLLETQAALAREQTQSMLVHAGKLVAIGRLVAGAVHEMGHPVGTLTLLAEALQAASADWPAPQREALHQLLGEAHRLHRFIARLRDFARDEPVHLQALDLTQVLAEARAIYAPRLTLERVQLTEQVNPVTVRVDRERLALAVANLAFNAADAMAGRAERRLRLHTAEEGPHHVALHVDDTGPGLSDAVLARLFEPFFTTKPEGQGLGLGLALSAESLVAMGGLITAGRAPGGGARFTIRLLRS